MVKHHYIVVQKPEGIIKYPMKQWLRDNPQYLPKNMDTSNTSHELRRALKNGGWGLEERADKVLLIKPSDDGGTPFVDELLEIDSETSDTLYEEEIAEAEEITFGLERDLKLALRANIEQIEPGLKIIDKNRERTTDAGRIDITAEDTQGNIVIIELKAGTASPQVIAQVLAYMGAVAETDHKPVRGILVAGDFHKRVILAARAVPNLQLKKYSFQFTFESVE